MKKLLPLSLMALAISISAVAQPVIQGSDVAYTAGETYTVHACQWQSPGPAGANQTWDFSNLVSQATVDIQMVTPSSTPSGSSFTGATVASYVDVQQTWQYVDMTGSSFVNYGVAVNSTPIAYSNTEVMFNFPLEYGNTNTDAFAASFINQVTWNRSGSVESEVDGYGTLITPLGTYTDVLRVKILQDYQDEPTGSPQNVSYDIDVYHWYKAGIHYPIVVNTSLTSQGQTQANVQYTDVSTGIKETDIVVVSVFPNPTTDVLSIISNDFSNGTYEVVNLVGKTVLHGTVSNGKVDLNALPNGIYVLKLISNDGETGISKFQVSK